MEKREGVVSENIMKELKRKGTLENVEQLFTSVNLEELHGALSSLQSRGLVVFQILETERTALTSEGEEILARGSHEYRVFLAATDAGVCVPEILSGLGAGGKIGLGKAVQNNWVEVKDGIVRRRKEEIVDETQVLLGRLDELSLSEISMLKKRKLVETKKLREFVVKKGKDFDKGEVVEETDLTKELLAQQLWKKACFKKYNYGAKGLQERKGALAGLLKMREEFREIFLEMGFVEMATNRFVESSFWNFDTLFQPQSHPSRDAQDTFFVSLTSPGTKFPSSLLENTRLAHSVGLDGSEGHRYAWKISEAERCILRTHTTAVTSRMLHHHSQKAVFEPGRYFSIDKVFRNEAVDGTHLAEFYQIEGVVLDYDLSLADLMGVLKCFFERLGLAALRFKPAFNPYTEPSMEVFAFHPLLGKHVEIGNSGMFRPEMMQAYGFGKDVVGIAWGLSLERPTMIKYGLKDIRKLVGHTADIFFTEKSGLCLV